MRVPNRVFSFVADQANYGSEHDFAKLLRTLAYDHFISIDYKGSGIANFVVDCDEPALLAGFESKVTKGLIRIYRQTRLFNAFDEETVKRVADFLSARLKIEYDNWEVSYAKTTREVDKAYDPAFTGVNSDSCMRGKYFVDFYAEQENLCLVVIHQNGEYKGRAALWTTDKGMVLDRCYPNNSLASDKLREWARSKGYWVRIGDEVTISGEKCEFERNGEYSSEFRSTVEWRGNMPYMDSFRFFDQWPNIGEKFEITTHSGGITGQTVENGFRERSGLSNRIWANCVICGKKDFIRNLRREEIGWKHVRCQKEEKCCFCGVKTKKTRILFNNDNSTDFVCEPCIVIESENLWYDPFWGGYRLR